MYGTFRESVLSDMERNLLIHEKEGWSIVFLSLADAGAFPLSVSRASAFCKKGICILTEWCCVYKTGSFDWYPDILQV